MSLDQTQLQTPRLEVRRLSRQFGDRQVVDNVDLSIAPGQVTCLLGPSGCGKSTTLRMIAGVDAPDAGEIKVDGALVHGPRKHVPPERRQIGLMFQDFALFPHLSVSDNVGFGLKGRAEARSERVKELLKKVDLGWAEHSFPHLLSGGEQQRVALARALAPRPRIMLMDEPFSGLDNRLRDGIRDETLALLKDEDTAVLLVTHEPEEALRMADEIALMRDGRIVQSGTPYAIYNAPVDRQAMGFFSDINILKGVTRGGAVETAFGKFSTPGIADNSAVDVVIRPQHIHLDFHRGGTRPAASNSLGNAVLATVERARFIGIQSLVELRIDQDGMCLKATLPNVFTPSAGHKFWVSLRRDRCFVFPAQ